MKNTPFWRYLLCIVPIVWLTACETVSELASSEQSPAQSALAVVEAAEDAIYSVAQDDQIGAEFLENFRDERTVGVIITPNMVQGGLVIGAGGGVGVIMAKADNSEWSYPAFVRQGSGNFGLQIGFKSSKVISIIQSDEQLATMLDGSPIAGGHLGGAVANEGAAFDYSGGLDVTSILKSFAVSKGAFVGVDVKLGGLWIDQTLNNGFYVAENPSAEDVVLKALFQNASADPLRNLLAQFQRNTP